jgi:hypothetical protein
MRFGRILGVALLAAVAWGGAAHAAGDMELPRRSLGSVLALPLVTGAAGAPADEAAAVVAAGAFGVGDGAAEPYAFMRRRDRPARATQPERPRPTVVLSPERARVLLRSLTVPGWGQLSTGHRTAATVFGVAELGVWTTYTAFRIQTQMRRDSYVRTARVLAGIDLRGRDEEFLRIIGAFASSDEYNQLVVARDAANLYYDDPAQFQAYVDTHSLSGADVWAWPDDEALLRYRGQRKDSQRAALRANAALAMAVVNRLLSAIHAARLHDAAAAHSWQMRAEPVEGDPTAFRVGVLRRF